MTRSQHSGGLYQVRLSGHRDRASGGVATNGGSGAGIVFSVAEHPKCTFCGKSQPQVLGMVRAGVTEVFICDECVALCADIFDQSNPGGWGGVHGPRTGR